MELNKLLSSIDFFYKLASFDSTKSSLSPDDIAARILLDINRHLKGKMNKSNIVLALVDKLKVLEHRSFIKDKDLPEEYERTLKEIVSNLYSKHISSNIEDLNQDEAKRFKREVALQLIKNLD